MVAIQGLFARPSAQPLGLEMALKKASTAPSQGTPKHQCCREQPARRKERGGSKRRKSSSRQTRSGSHCPVEGSSTATHTLTSRAPTENPSPTHPCMFCFAGARVNRRVLGQREGLYPNRGCWASLYQTQHTTRGQEPGAIPDGSSRLEHQWRCVPSPIHRNTVAGGKAVMLREFLSLHCSNKHKEQMHAGGLGELGKMIANKRNESQ